MSQQCESHKCSPICSLQELKNLKFHTDLHQPKNTSVRCFAPSNDGSFRECSTLKTPRTLVCHDMKGGYLDDCLTDGSPNNQAYNFIQWSLVDIFVYFSHNFITVPPPCWVHAAHLHGVHILGTIITEWDSGRAICDELFSSKDSVDEFVKQLKNLTLLHNCDGWLVNIENPIDKSIISNVTYFLHRLKTELKYAGNNAIVIWYDSITKDGELDWQNELNQSNRDFFDACDGIFLNYVWKPENLIKSATLADKRILDVYVGIDVFGRNCHGGGGFNTSEALALVRQNGLSAALFAPGWVYECHPVDDFQDLSTRFWTLLLPYMHLKGPSLLPIRTSFCPGSGKGKFECGKLVTNQNWHNISDQQLQPCLIAFCGLAGDSSDKLFALKDSQLPFGKQRICDIEAFKGGCCLQIESPVSAIFPLFYCDVFIKKNLSIIIIYKCIDGSQCLNLKIGFKSSSSNNSLYITCPLSPHVDEFGEVSFTDWNGKVITATFSPTLPGDDIYAGPDLRCFNKSFQWNRRSFHISFNDGLGVKIVKTISLESLGSIECRLGYFCCYES